MWLKIEVCNLKRIFLSSHTKIESTLCAQFNNRMLKYMMDLYERIIKNIFIYFKLLNNTCKCLVHILYDE